MFSGIRIATGFVDVLKSCPRPGPLSYTPSTPFLLLHWCRNYLRLCRCGPLYDPVRRRPLGRVLARLAYLPHLCARRINQDNRRAGARKGCASDNASGEEKQEKKKVRRIEGNSPQVYHLQPLASRAHAGDLPSLENCTPWQNPANWARFVVGMQGEGQRERERNDRNGPPNTHPNR
ncbi:hypothetical protein LZ31DRAFT_257796 [Colletotrichum somersetense]|nr:hypothetical protein LZ31DRAFT_257796 [Colletotrichum somersetense]